MIGVAVLVNTSLSRINGLAGGAAVSVDLAIMVSSAAIAGHVETVAVVISATGLGNVGAPRGGDSVVVSITQRVLSVVEHVIVS